MNLIALDLDGTLVDSRADMTAVVHRLRGALGLPPRSDEAIRPFLNRGMTALYRECFDDYIGDADERYTTVRTRYESEYFASVAVETRLYPSIADAVARLTDQGSLAVVTNKPERITRRLLEELKIADYFTTVIGGDTCERPKPDPIVLSEAARRCHADHEDCRIVMIGDTAADITLGHSVGARTIWCAWGYVSDVQLDADFVADHPKALPDVVRAAFAT